MHSTIFMASAGSGKTSMLIDVLKYHIENGVDPKKILVISYTKNAVDEIFHRLQRHFSENILNILNLNTLHSFCFNYLTENNIIEDKQVIEKFSNNFLSIIPESLLQNLHIKKWQLSHLIQGISTESLYYTIFNNSQYEKMTHFKKTLKENLILRNQLYDIFEFLKNTMNTLDFSDMVIELYRIINMDYNHLNHLSNLWHGFDIILVDEVQDFSPMQLEILIAMIKEFIYNYSKSSNNDQLNINNKKFFLFGDIKQSIFNFQGADINFFRETINNLCILAKKYEYPYIIKKINSTYRLPKKINSFINKLHNITKLNDFQKHETNNHNEGNIFYQQPLIKMEDTQIINNILNLIQYLLKSKYSIQDIMIIFRTRNKLVYQLGEKLSQANFNNVPLDITNIKENSTTIKLLWDIINLLENLDSNRHWIEFIGEYLIDYLDEDILKEIINNINNKNFSENIVEYLKKNTYNFKKILLLFEHYKDKITLINPYDFIINEIFNISLFQEKIKNDKIEMIFSILKDAKDFKGDLLTFLQNLPNNVRVEQSGIQMHTVYGAKGLQNKIVIICDGHKSVISNDWKERFFTYYEGFSSKEEKEVFLKEKNNNIWQEYLRILYVATTRASDSLYIFGGYPIEVYSLLWYIQEHFSGNTEKIMINDDDSALVLYKILI